MTRPLLELENLSKTFHVGPTAVQAVQDLTLAVEAGECLAIVGESGSGKSTIANMILGVFRPTTGILRLDGDPLPPRRRLSHRRRIQLVQQNPLSSLNPNRTVGASLRLALDVHKIGKPSDRPAHVIRLLEEVGLDGSFARRPPAALSGGQRQRVAIARARSCNSELIVLDEPTSALDVIVQARVLKLLAHLRALRSLTYLFITHDLAVVRCMADRVAVMREGCLVELETTDAIFTDPQHTYTRNLIAASPVVTSEEIAIREQLLEGLSHDG